MDVATLKQKIAAGEDLVLLDVRDADEIRRDSFFVVPPQHYLNIPILPLIFSTREELEEKIFVSLGLPVTTPIVALCPRAAVRREYAKH
jgi:rhodanese-related sulfurtransferase